VEGEQSTWKAFFDAHAPVYDDKVFTKNTNPGVADGRFDPMTLVESGEYPPREGLPPVPLRERGFVPTELNLLFRLAGLSVLNMWGGTAGNWEKRPLDLDEIEIMIVARKTDKPADAVDAWLRAG